MPNDGMSDNSAYDPARDDHPVWALVSEPVEEPKKKTDTWGSRDEFKNRSIDVMTATIMWALVAAVVIFLLGGAVAAVIAVFF